MRFIAALLLALVATPFAMSGAQAQTACAGFANCLPTASGLSGNEVIPLDQSDGNGHFITSQVTVSALLRAINPPSVSARGGVYSVAPTVNLFMTGIDTTGLGILARPACANLSNAAPSCSVDTTNMANITSGNLAAGRLPAFTGGDVTSSAGSAVLSIGAGRVTASQLATGAAVGNIANGTITAAMLAAGAAATNCGGSCGSGGTTGALLASNNLSDVASASSARTNLGLGALATLGTASVLQPSNNLSDLGSAASARSNLGLGSMALASTGSYLATTNNLSDLTNSGTARSNLGLGSASTASTGTSGATLPFANGSNTFSGNNTFSGSNGFSNTTTFSGLTVTGTAGFSGSETHSGTVAWSGKLNVPTRVISASGSVTVSNTTDYFICIAKTTGAATPVNLPSSPSVGDTYLIKDCKGDANTNNITLTPASGTIDGASTYVLNTAYGSVAVTYSGLGWAIN